MNLFINLRKTKSKNPKREATTTDMPITIRVYLIVSLRVGQVIFLISELESLKRFAIFILYRLAKVGLNVNYLFKYLGF